MSNVNLKRLVENIPPRTTVYTPIVEVVVNAIQAIHALDEQHGKVTIRIRRDDQVQMDGALSDICGFDIEDNGIGFTDENRDAFDTLYTDLKIKEGGKGFGRFVCLKYFEDVMVRSGYRDNGHFKQREFSMGKTDEIIVGHRVTEVSTAKQGSMIQLRTWKKTCSIEKKPSTIARKLVERLLPFFIAEDYHCPEIILCENDGTGEIVLNDYCSNELSAHIKEFPLANSTFSLTSNSGTEDFLVRVFKLYNPDKQRSKISLVAHRREVSGSAIERYVPEFCEEFYDRAEKDGTQQRNYIVKAYVFSPYLDKNVSVERGGFEFPAESTSLFGLSQADIERSAAGIAKEAVGADVAARREKKRERVHSYVDEEAPWHKAILEKIDLTDMPYKPENAEIERRLQEEKFKQETQLKKEVSALLAEPKTDDLDQHVQEIVSKISASSKNDLVHYLALRRQILDIFERGLQVDEDGNYASEGSVHDTIFPRKCDTQSTSFEDHNRWMIDERLNFTSYISSDLPINGNGSDRPDLLVYNQRIVFRGDNEAGNPVTIFEFKKPQRDDFVNPSSKEDPVAQIVRYVNGIRDGEHKTPEGRKILVAENTPYYGFVVCDLTLKVERWLEREKDFKPMPDGLGWFQWFDNINLYIEVISWDKVLKDAKMRNKIFFHKLGI